MSLQESIDYSASPVLLKALEDLDYRLTGKVKPFDLYVVGGGAMILEEVTTNHNQYTDIDYIGEDLEDLVDFNALKTIREVGLEYNLGKNWINNDVVMSGFSSLEDIEFATGELHFKKILEMNVITVYCLIPKDILRMKVIAVDTQLSVINVTREYNRTKDWFDIRELVEYLGFSGEDVILDSHDLICFSLTEKVIKKLCSTPNNEAGNDEVKQLILSKYKDINFY